MTVDTAAPSKNRKWLKTLPGVLISLFFLWYTFKGISFKEIQSLRVVQPGWILGVVGFTLVSYTLRCVRWTRMMRPVGSRFRTCARVLMTSFAANNILPLRIGDIMRVFTYANDLGASPPVILSTVILEKLLDIFVLVLLFVSFMGPGVAPHSRATAEVMLAVSTVGLLVMLLGARALELALKRIFAKLPQNEKLEKMENRLLLAVECVEAIGVAGSLVLLVQSMLIWACEGMIFVSAAQAIGLVVERVGPWQAVSVANLSYLIPSSPGAIGTFEWAVKTALVSHGAAVSSAALYGLAMHAWLLISVTGAGGVLFLVHRARIHNHASLVKEIEMLPAELPLEEDLPHVD
jgi:glycosyltransferase 2 family protein